MTEPDAPSAGFADRVDAEWDALVRGSTPATDGLAPELTAEIRRLCAADRAPHADPAFLARLREELSMTPTAPLAFPPLRPRGSAPTPNGRVSVAPAAARRPAPQARRRWWGAVERLAAAVLVLGLAGGYLAIQAGTPPTGEGPPAARLFHVGSDGRILTPLDPVTLVILPDVPPVTVPGPVVTEGSDRGGLTSRWTLSPDGSTSITVEYPVGLVGFTAEAMDIVVRAGLTGPDRARFHPPAPILPEVGTSADGARIVAERAAIDPTEGVLGPTNPRRWYVLDAGSGALLATIGAGEPDPVGGPWPAWLAPGGERVYRLGASGPPSAAGPGPLRLFAYDAETGVDVDRLDLPGVPADVSRTSSAVAAKPDALFASTALARSGDGRRLALVHQGSWAMTLVDLRRFAIEATVPGQPTSRAGSARPGTDATPGEMEPATSTPPESWQAIWAAFAADGRGVYVGGQEFEEGVAGALSCRDLGVRRIDLPSGAVVGRLALPGASSPVMVSPHGDGVYSVGPNVADKCFFPAEAGSVLRRLDADTLEVLAERELTGHPSIELVPRAASGR